MPRRSCGGRKRRLDVVAIEPGPRFSRARGGIAHFTEIVRTSLAAPLLLWRRRDCRAPRGASGPGQATARKRRALGQPFDRKHVVEGKRGQDSVDMGGVCNIQKKKQQ